MKKICLFIIGFLSCVTLMGQVKELVIISFPSGAKKLSNEQMRTMANNNKKFPEDLKADLTRDGEYYKIDSFTLALYGGRVNIDKNYLDDSKKGFESMFKKMNCSTCTAEIKKINNYTALIAFIDTRDISYYFFYTVNNNNNASVNGSINYDRSNPDNKKKALKTINELLNSMKFK